MAANSGLLLAALFVVGAVGQASASNAFVECMNFLVCGSDGSVCGTNGTYCWLAASECERTKFNCLHARQKDFHKVDSEYCEGYTVGGIEPCCIRRRCPSRNELICGQDRGKMLNVCRWFRNRCELENANCGTEFRFAEVSKDLCNFEYDDAEQYCASHSGDLDRV